LQRWQSLGLKILANTKRPSGLLCRIIIMTEYGKLLLKTQRDANLIAVASFQLQATMTKEKRLIDLAVSLGERVTKTCEEVNNACDFT